MSVLSSSRLDWYVRRAARMSPAEAAWRARDQAVQLAWSRRQVQPGQPVPAVPARPAGARSFAAVLPPQAADAVPAPAAEAVLKAADRLLRGEWEVLGVARTDLVQPDWFADPVTGRRAPADRYAFRINHRSQEQTGNIKQVWEISRLHHLTLLATAWYLSRDEAYAERVAAQLRSWWQDNPFLSGVHWTSGIEIGIRLISFAWIRRLLDDWPPVTALFERSELAVAQIRWHQQYLAGFRSRGSSANNHVIAEAAGQLVAACAFPWYPESERWRRAAARLLEQELDHNTFPSGIGRELASGYQGFVAELGLVAAVEAQAAGHPLSAAAWQRLAAMTDSGAALLDQRLRPPRQGDGDDGCALVLDAPAPNRWPSLLALGDALLGRLDWWPAVAADAGSTLAGALAGPPRDIAAGRRSAPIGSPTPGSPCCGPAPSASPRSGAGATAARTASSASPRTRTPTRCRWSSRYGGVDILADPGTYCYHGEPAWRTYFRSTIGHNTVELGGQSQSAEGGPFLWLRRAEARETEVLDTGDTAAWTAEHDGYLALDPPATHRRSSPAGPGGRRRGDHR